MNKLLEDALTVETTLKDQILKINESNAAMKKAIAIWSRENAGSKINFANDDEAVRWFIAYTNIIDRVSPDPDKEV